MRSSIPRAEDIRNAATDVLLRLCIGARADLFFQSAHRSLRRVFETHPTSVTQAKLHAAAELVRRAALEDMRGRVVLNNSASVKDFLSCHFLGYGEERFTALWLDAQNRVITFEELFRGTFTQTSVYPREVVKAALRHNAAGVIFSHNHPSGVAEPSIADEALTRALKQALGLVDVKVVDNGGRWQTGDWVRRARIVERKPPNKGSFFWSARLSLSASFHSRGQRTWP